jgi:hypothetical protein
MHTKQWSAAILTTFLILIAACTTVQPPVVEKLDELTAVTMTYCRTALVMSPDTPMAREARRDYVQVGVIEINRMGTLQYYLWLGINEVHPVANADGHPQAFESIRLSTNSDSVDLNVSGWTPAVMGASESVYQKLFPDSADAYYQIELDDIQLLADSDNLKLHTTGLGNKEFVSWYRQETFDGDLAEFLRTVMQ